VPFRQHQKPLFCSLTKALVLISLHKSVMCTQTSPGVNGSLPAAARSSGDSRATSSSSSSRLYEVELHRGSRGFGFAIRGGKEFDGMPICVLNIASGGPADRDGRLQVGLIVIRFIYEYLMLTRTRWWWWWWWTNFLYRALAELYGLQGHV